MFARGRAMKPSANAMLSARPHEPGVVDQSRGQEPQILLVEPVALAQVLADLARRVRR
jgi:hypothetical protein